jgi:thiamine kinase-like enzyme
MDEKSNNQAKNALKSVKIELPPSLFIYLKENDKRLEEVKHLGGHSVLGTTYLLELKSIKDETPEQCAFRLFTAIRPFEFEFFISKAMGLNGVSPKILFEDHQAKFWVQEYIKNNIFLRPGRKFNEECIRQIGVYLRKIHTFSPAMKPPNTLVLIERIKTRVKNNLQRFPDLSRFQEVINREDRILKIFEKNSEKCFCHNDFGYGWNLLWDQKRLWVVDWEFSGIFYPYYDIGATISLLILNDQEREIFLNGYYGRARTPKEEALIYLGEVFALVHYSLCTISIIRNLKIKLDDKFYDSLTEWNGLKTGKAIIENGEFGYDIGNVKIGVMMYKQAELYINSPKFQISLKNLDI